MTLQKLDETIGSVSYVPSVTQLDECSWEMLVLKAYIATLRCKLHNLHASFTLDEDYDPFEPIPEDVERWGLDAARDLCVDWTTKRAKQIIKDSWYIASEYYQHLMDHQCSGRGRRLSWMGPKRISLQFSWRSGVVDDGKQSAAVSRRSWYVSVEVLSCANQGTRRGCAVRSHSKPVLCL